MSDESVEVERSIESGGRRGRRWRKAVVRGSIGGVLVGVIAPVWVFAVAAPGIDEPSEVPGTDVAMVLGAGLTEQDTPSPFLAGRLEVAADLYQRRRVKVLLLSGDNSRPDYNEPKAMRDHLLARGVPASAIVLDYAGFDTWDSCRRAREVFGVRSVTVVTQNFHLYRGVAACRWAGMTAHGVGHNPWRNHKPATAKGWLREIPSSWKLLWDARLADTTPRFPGPVNPAVSEALARAEHPAD